VVVDLWGRRWTKGELLARVGRLEQLAGVQLVEAGDGAERGVRLLQFRTRAGFDFEVLVDRGFQRFPRASLPHHVTWRQLGSGTYVVAMEPSTNRDAGRFDARSRSELQHLAPGEQRRYQLEIGALLGAEAIDAFAARTAALTASALTTTSGGST
jgi:Domain of unknown function (DUF4432)